MPAGCWPATSTAALGAGRARLPGRLRGRRGSRRDRALPLGQRRARVDLLRRTRAGVLCPGARRGPAPRGDDSSGRTGSCQLRPASSPRRTSCPRARSATSSPFHFRVAAGSGARPCSSTQSTLEPWPTSGHSQLARPPGATDGRQPGRRTAPDRGGSRQQAPGCPGRGIGPAPPKQLRAELSGRCWPSTVSGCHLRW